MSDYTPVRQRQAPAAAVADPDLRRLLAGLTAVRDGDFRTRLPQDGDGLLAEIATVFNGMVDQLSLFTSEVTRVAREVGTEGQLGGQAEVPGVSGTWKDLTDSVNAMAGNLTDQVRDIAQVATAVATGDLSQKITVDVRGEILELKNTINTMVDQLSSFADEVTRVAREVGSEGRLGGQAQVSGVAGTWRDLTDSVNFMAGNLTNQVRNIAQVTTAVARGDLSQKITVDARGEILELKSTINTMVDQLSSFADEVTRVAREVGTDGRLGGQAQVSGVAGTWRDLTDSVNSMAGNLTGQVRSIAQVATAVARGDLSQKITVTARGEILELKSTINTMVDQLSSFADEVTRVAREVGTEGQLGGQAEVEGVSGTWKRLTENVNELAGNLTRQVRAIAEVTSAVATGDLTRSITVDASGEVAELKDNINFMVQSLRETTRANQEQDWLKTNLARIASLMQGHRDLGVVATLVLNELAPLVNAQLGTFLLMDESTGTELRVVGCYGHAGTGRRFALGESLVGQAAVGKRPIVVNDLPGAYFTVSSSLGAAVPMQLVVLPIVVEDQVLGVIELAAMAAFTDVHRDFLDQLMEAIGVNVSTIVANARTDVLLTESQRLAAELQARSEELQARSEELQRSNAELEDKATLLARQNHDIETKNSEIEQARQELEARAQQLALASKYKSEFLANMSHELRTPLNSLLILAQLLAQNPSHNLTAKQVEYAGVIHSAGTDLLQLINDILDLSKVEAGKMDIAPEAFDLRVLVEYVEATFRPLTTARGLAFDVSTAADVPAGLFTDDQRLRQVLRNLLSNAVKFTEAGRVRLRIEHAHPDELSARLTGQPTVLAFRVVDTGIGIADQQLSAIFDAFQQADGTTSRRYGGTGLGLSISREIAHLLGGEIRAQSELGRGSTFTLYLPATQEPVPAVAAVPGFARTRRLLVVESPPNGLLTLLAEGAAAAVAGKHGPVRVVTAVDTETAIADLRAEPCHAVVLDLAMPADTGSAFLHALHEDPALRDVPVLAYQGQRLSAAQETLLQALSQTRPLEVLPGLDELRERITAQLSGAAAAHLTPAPAADFGRLSTTLAGRKVLVVDDDARNVFALTNILELHGIQVRYAENGRRGIEILAEQSDIDLILMDVMMPEMDGYAATAAIRAMPEYADLPIIAVTAKAMQGDREKSLTSGASDYVTKPVDAADLLACIDRWLAAKPE
ncbi:HAMP domain-containing protein [Actinoplanes sp. NPDC051859]|uniref:HAMP domain-containing protein n=1 Tax=Actinoplanes sp. NPDC051859 TaxID=3363909 RepID=UPI00379E7397